MSGVTGMLAAALGSVVVLLIAYLKGRLAGAKLERAKQQAEELRARDAAAEIQNDIGALPPDIARERLKRWSKG